MRRLAVVFAALVLGACSDDGPVDAGQAVEDAGSLPLADLQDPETCKDCHPRHYREWASSMHAYAAEDPVFRAMNARGQRETNGELGDFCVGCHAPMAVREGFTTDGLNLDEAPDHLKGVTCYFCHNVVAVEGEHNNPLVLANDTTMRGSILDPVRPSAHGVEYSPLHDGAVHESSSLCGSCHDIVTPSGVHLERTFAEWKDSVFGSDSVLEGFTSCNQCHMLKRTGVAADDPDVRVGQREVHEHLWASVDVALTPFPDREIQQKAVEFELSRTVLATLTVLGLEAEVLLEGQSGHHTPSGAAQDRRMWVELLGYDAGGNLIFASGDVADDEIVDKPLDDPARDPHLLLFRDVIFDATGEETHMFWEAAPSDVHPDGFESVTLPGTTQFGVPHTVSKSFVMPQIPARVTMRLRVRPMGLDVLDDLVDSGDLDPVFRDAMPTHTLAGTVLEWTEAEHGLGVSVKRPTLSPPGPEAYRCLLDPDAIECTDG